MKTRTKDLRLNAGVIIAVLLLISKPMFARVLDDEADNIIWESTSSSKIELHDHNSAVIENHEYLYADYFGYHGETRNGLVILQKIIWKVGNWEGNNPTLNASAFRIMPDGKQENIWSISEEADEGRLDRNYYHTIWYGCCSACPNHRLYNPQTGRLIMEYSRELLSFEIPNTPLKRYVGYKPSETITTNSWEKDINHIGTLTYSSPDRMLQRIALKMIGDGEDKFGIGFASIVIVPGDGDRKLNGNNLILWEANYSEDPRKFTNIQIKMVFYAGFTIMVPVREDGFYFDQTEFDGYEIVAIPE